MLSRVLFHVMSKKQSTIGCWFAKFRTTKDELLKMLYIPSNKIDATESFPHKKWAKSDFEIGRRKHDRRIVRNRLPSSKDAITHVTFSLLLRFIQTNQMCF